MYIAIAVVFILGYVAIALEHPIKIDKAAFALFTAAVCWALFVFGRTTLLGGDPESTLHVVEHDLMSHLAEIASILFFLLGAMTIVELVDSHGGFSIITDRMKISGKVKLLITLSIVTFFMSAALDNLTTAIVMATLLRKIVSDKRDLWLFAGMMIIAANAGGAWSPIGDVTTIMLWIGGQVTAGKIMVSLLIPSIVAMAVPLAIIGYRMRGQYMSRIEMPASESSEFPVERGEKRTILFMGIGALLFVPVFKTVTHLPPFLGVLFGLSILWATVEWMHRNKEPTHRHSLSIGKALERVDTQSILFFLGILLAVAALQSAGHLTDLASLMDSSIHDIWIVNGLIGILSAVVDNVPLVAGAMGMYDISVYPTDHVFWKLLAYAAGTGGSCLIIGSAAGVAVMGILKIDFIWYLKYITLAALAGYLTGFLTYWLIFNFL